MRQLAVRTVLIAVCTFGSVIPSAFGQSNVTIQATHHRAIGGVSKLDRAKFFNYTETIQGPSSSNLGNLREQTWSPTGLNLTTGRVSTELDANISRPLPEDPNKPGFFDHAALIHDIQFGSLPDQRNSYKALVTGKQQDGSDFPAHLSWVGSRWEGLRKQQELSLTNPKVDAPIFIQSGRNGGQWPDFLDSGGLMPTNYEAYADFLNVYLEEAVYGTEPSQGFLPIDKDRFYLEVMNEPNWSTPNQSQWDEVIEMHRVVTELVKEQFPQTKIGGPSCCDNLGGGIDGWERSKQLMDDMADWQTPSGQSVELDFWTIHPYEHYRVQSDGSPMQTSRNSPGHVSGVLDLYESYSQQKFGDTKAFAITEYGSWNSTSLANGSFGNYSRPEQQWDLVRDVREKMMVFMDRPDRIINATPFVAPAHWQSGTPTPVEGDNVFFEQDAAGNWSETIIAKMFRMFAAVSGQYVPVDSDNTDLQTIAFRDGNEIYVLLNNLEKADNTISLQALAGSANVTSASLDRLFWNGTEGIYQSDRDVSSSWQNLTLAGEEGAVLKLTLSGPQLYDLSTNENTYYGDVVTTPIGAQGKSQVVNIAADTENAVSAQVRVGFNRGLPGASPGEEFFIFVNDTPIRVTAGELNFDDGDIELVSRTGDVPLSALIDGNNEVYVDFVGTGGELVSAVLVVTESIGDFDGSGVFDGGDLSALLSQFGPATPGNEYDLDSDGVVGGGDLQIWLSDFRGKTEGFLGDFNLDDAVDGDDLAVWQDGYSNDGDDFGDGDFNFDSEVAGIDFLGWQVATASLSSVSSAQPVPEPSAMVMLMCSFLLVAKRRQG